MGNSRQGKRNECPSALQQAFAVVHNGIIENYKEIKESLEMSGVSFVSDTDTEVVPKLLELNYSGDVLEAIKKHCAFWKALMRLE